MKDHTKETMRRAAMAGVGAMGGLKAAHVPAKLAARIPVIGPALGVGTLAAGALLGALKAVGQPNS